MKLFKIILPTIAIFSGITAMAQDIEADSVKVFSRFDLVDNPVLDFVSSDKKAMAEAMLDRVERITLLDTIHVDSVAFVEYYRLSKNTGFFTDKPQLRGEFPGAPVGPIYCTDNARECFWAEPVDSNLVLMGCRVLDDNTCDEPYLLLNEATADIDGDCNYPFVMQDGYTIYFANNGSNSLGGYDIFMTRRSPEGDVLQPQNIGMPFNSPFNDYLMVIDEDNDVGWWASDREGIPGIVTLYVFRPSEMRVNYDIDTDDIERLALMLDVDVPGYDYDPYDEMNTISTDTSVYPMWINGQQVVSYTQVDAPDAQQIIRDLSALYDDNYIITAQLNDLRMQYAAGDKSTTAEIIANEKRQKNIAIDIQRLKNRLVERKIKINPAQ